MGNCAFCVLAYANAERHQVLSHSMRMFIAMDVLPFVDEEIEPVGMLRVETESSIWFVTPERYQRLPREERPRPEVRSIEHRLADGEWHRLRQCWWRVHHDGARQMRLLPEVGPAGGVGVITGVIIAVTGSWTAAASESSPAQ